MRTDDAASKREEKSREVNAKQSLRQKRTCKARSKNIQQICHTEKYARTEEKQTRCLHLKRDQVIWANENPFIWPQA